MEDINANNINSISFFYRELQLFHPPSHIFPHTSRAALMGPDDHRNSGGRAVYGGCWKRFLQRAESLSRVPPGFSRQARGKEPLQGVWRATLHIGQNPDGRTTRPVSHDHAAPVGEAKPGPARMGKLKMNQMIRPETGRDGGED